MKGWPGRAGGLQPHSPLLRALPALPAQCITGRLRRLRLAGLSPTRVDQCSARQAVLLLPHIRSRSGGQAGRHRDVSDRLGVAALRLV